MAKAGYVKCPRCKQRSHKDNMLKVGSRYWHHDCRQLEMQEKDENEAEELKIKKRDSEEYKELIACICDLFNIKRPTGMILKQVKEYHNEPFGYRYKAIQLALEYFFIIKEHSTADARGIGIVPYIYDEAAEFWKTMAEFHSLEETEKEEAQTITIRKQKENKRKRKNRFDMDKL